MKRLIPNLHYTHPGYFGVAVALILTHFVLGIENLDASRHNTQIWYYVRHNTPDHSLFIWSLAHFATATCITAGLYTKFEIARVGFLLSFIEFNVLAINFCFAAIHFHLTFYNMIVAVALSLTSYRAYKEPEVNTLSSKKR